MKSVFDSTTQKEITDRINSLSSSNKALWGKMDLLQMVKHCILCDDMYLGNIKIKRAFIGRLIGKLMLKKVLADEAPFHKNSPTIPALKTAKEDGNLESKKGEWLSRINGYNNFNNPNFVHPFFGTMTKDQIGNLSYKHIDHHLRQFGA
jgi:hypothetical protein